MHPALLLSAAGHRARPCVGSHEEGMKAAPTDGPYGPTRPESTPSRR